MKKVLLCLALVVVLTGCEKENSGDDLISKSSLSGAVQKGPFVNGTSISINELEENLSQTGKTFNTQITNSQGSFEINNVELISNFVHLQANGFYFNEILGEQSSAQLTLNAISDVSNKTTINVNILSHLEKERVEYLIGEGSTFKDAKSQAQNEVLDIFGFSSEATQSSELLDISQSGENNAMLLAASLILNGYRTEGELTELLSNISEDLKEDGTLDDLSLGSDLVNHVGYLDVAGIRENLETRYEELDIDAEIPNFEKYIKEFVEGTDFEITEKLIEYPENGEYGPNILDLDKLQYSGGHNNGNDLSLAVKLKKSATLMIKITSLGEGLPWHWSGSDVNWNIFKYDFETNSQIFNSIDDGKSCDLNMVFDVGQYRIEYFEMNSDSPTFSKEITVTE
ncbi:hypothetical protein [Flagellimonas flava]|uniref:hypothetical protein n=1 Tax=Flagellimonas flava TaxID=570519 RepID=UPI003D649631